MKRRNWNLDDDEYCRKFEPKKARSAYPDTGEASPILLLVEHIPLIARALTLHLQVAIGVPIVLLIGSAMYESRFLPELLVGSFPIGFAIGLRSYFKRVTLYGQQDRYKLLRAILGVQTPPPNPLHIVAWTVGLPAGLFLGSVLIIWAHNRFMAAAIPAIICGAVFYRWGGAPIRFYEQYLLCQVEMPSNARVDQALVEPRPNVPALAVILIGIVAVPILFSNTVALLALTVGLTAMASSTGFALWEMAPKGKAIVYFLTFAHRVCQRFVSYPEIMEDVRPLKNLDTWAPPTTAWLRMRIFFGLLGSLYLALIVGLSYYCPWEFFAKLCTDAKTASLRSPGTLFADYSWLFAPFELISVADPLAGYLICFVFAIAGFLIIPPAILLVIYLPRLLQLEEIRQELKSEKSQTWP